MVTITLYVRQQKRHRCIEQSFVLCGRGRGWDDLGEWHWNIYNICETNRQSRFDAWYRILGAGALGWPRGMLQGGRWERGSGWGTRVHLWWIHVDVWQNLCIFMYTSISFNKILSTTKKKKEKTKPLQYCKVINLQLNKFILKKFGYSKAKGIKRNSELRKVCWS